jgi:hypothetical protein
MHVKQEGIEYYNSGGWIDSRLTYITIGNDGVQIHEYREPIEEHAEEANQSDSSEAELTDDLELFDVADHDTKYEEVGL